MNYTIWIPILAFKDAYINKSFPLKAILDKRIEIIKSFVRNSKATTVEITTDNPRKLGEKVLNPIDIKTSYEN